MNSSKIPIKETLLNHNTEELKKRCDYTIAIAGNPNVGKSTIFNHLTGMHQHTGNWPGKTVANATGTYEYKNKQFLLVDIPGTYSLMSHSEEEEIARNYICFGNPDITVVVLDATCLERNLNLVFQVFEITTNVIVCVNLLDEAQKKGIHIDLKKLSEQLGVPVVGTVARKKKTLHQLKQAIHQVCTKKIIPTPHPIVYLPSIENGISLLTSELQQYDVIPSTLYRWVSLKLLENETQILSSIESYFDITFKNNESLHSKMEEVICLLSRSDIYSSNFRDKLISSIIRKSENIRSLVCCYQDKNYQKRNQKIDQVLTSKKFGIPIMLLFLGILFWITIIGANYPSSILSNWFGILQNKLLERCYCNTYARMDF